MNRIGTQTFGLGKELSADLPGTLRRLRDMGFEAVEPLLPPLGVQGPLPKNLWAGDTLHEARKLLDQLGMDIPSAHLGLGMGPLSLPAGAVIRKIRAIHDREGIRLFVVSGPFDSAAGAERWGKLLRRVAEGVRPLGCTVAYHNHDDEFRPVTVDGEQMTALDHFFTHAGPEVLLQLDMGWASVAGDEVELARRYGDRIVSLHLKDFYPGCREEGLTRQNMPAEKFAPIGSGAVRTGEVLALRGTFPRFNGCLILDQDRTEGDMLEALATGCRNARNLLNGRVV